MTGLTYFKVICHKRKWFNNYTFTFITDCALPSAPSHGTVKLTVIGVTMYGATAMQSCNTGYKHSGSRIIQCQANGKWSASITCTIQGIVYLFSVGFLQEVYQIHVNES